MTVYRDNPLSYLALPLICIEGASFGELPATFFALTGHHGNWRRGITPLEYKKGQHQKSGEQDFQ